MRLTTSGCGSTTAVMLLLLNNLHGVIINK